MAGLSPGPARGRTAKVAAIGTVIDVALLGFLLVVALTIVVRRSLVSATLLSSFFSLMMAGAFVLLDAVDVAFAEAAVGAGIVTVLTLSTLGHTTTRERVPARRPWIPLAVVLAVTVLLVYGTLDLPALGDPQSPAYTHVAPRYLALGGVETGVPNIVTAILASYRGFDTLGELTVIFTAGLAVLALLAVRSAASLGQFDDAEGRVLMDHHLILRVVAKLLIPVLLLFGLYVQFHGEHGPGGGFQAGVLFAAGMILYALVFGTGIVARVAPLGLIHALMALGLLLFAGTGLASFVYGGAYLDYGVFGHDFVAGQRLGIFLVELGVGIAVAATMIAIYLSFAERKN